MLMANECFLCSFLDGYFPSISYIGREWTVERVMWSMQSTYSILSLKSKSFEGLLCFSMCRFYVMSYVPDVWGELSRCSNLLFGLYYLQLWLSAFNVSSPQ